MWFFTDVADWFDTRKKQSNAVLDRMVEDSDYSQGAMLMAATGHAFMEFGGGFVDLLRLGDGVKKGGLSGWGQDALRVVAVFPVGRAAHLLKTIKNTRAAKFLVDIAPDGPICAWVASAKALRQVGHAIEGKVLASVDDLASALGVSVQSIKPIRNLSTVVQKMRQIGAIAGPVRRVSNMRQVEQMLPKDGSVVLVTLSGVHKTDRTLISHLVYVYRDLTGRICIMDRSVGDVIRRSYFSLSELVKSYPVTSFVPYEAAVLKNVFVRSSMHELPRLVIPVPAVIASYQDQEKK